MVIRIGVRRNFVLTPRWLAGAERAGGPGESGQDQQAGGENQNARTPGGGFARPFDVERWMLDVGCTGPSNPRLRPATFIQPAPSIPAPAAFCPCRRGHASGSPVIPRRVPEVDHEIPFVCRALPLLFGFLAVFRGRGNQKSSVGAPCLWQTRSLVSISSASSSSNPSPTSNGCATGWRRGKERRENEVSAGLCTAMVEIDLRLRGNLTEDLLTEESGTER